MPELYVFTLRDLLKAYIGTLPIPENIWNSRFKPYFPKVDPDGTYKATKKERAFAENVYKYIETRQEQIEEINTYIESDIERPDVQVTGIRMLRLRINEAEEEYLNVEEQFYKVAVTERRPFMRLIPSENTPVSKVHVTGVLPVPTVEDANVILDWAKETSPTPGQDYMYIKYLHSPRISKTRCPIYGTIRILNDGTLDIYLQPAKDQRKLEPEYDFRNFETVITEALEDLPYSTDDFKLAEAAMLFSLSIPVKSERFTRKKIQARIPMLQPFFQEIQPLPGQNPIISLRYKAVSEFVTESKMFSFITQLSTKQKLDGEGGTVIAIQAVSAEFQVTLEEARRVVEEWLEDKSKYSSIVPEENEFIKSYNPGVDIHIYGQHPKYTMHVNRINSFETFQRIYTLLGILFIEDDGYFNVEVSNAEYLNETEEELQRNALNKEEEGQINESMMPKDAKGEDFEEENSSNLDLMMPTSNSEEEVVASVAMASVKPIMEEKKVDIKAPGIRVVKAKPADDTPIDPKNWFIKKLKEVDNDLFGYTPKIEAKGYSRLCQANVDKQPSVLTPNQYERMRAEYEPDEERREVFFIEYPLEGDEDPRPPARAEVYTVLKFGSDPAHPNYYFCPPLFVFVMKL